MSNNTEKKPNYKKLLITAVVAVALVTIAFSFKEPSKLSSSQNTSMSLSKDSTKDVSKDISLVKDMDIVIETMNVTEEPAFYPAEMNGVQLEVIAVKASDGTIRTAFNTCQVCYSSGKGYYEVDGKELVCQNCGNRFGMDEVAVNKGGCNPVPITEEYKTQTDETITISKEFLVQAATIFENWK